MLISTSSKIYLFAMPTDMRKGFDGLAAIVRQHEFNLFEGAYFIFISKRADRIKILNWDHGGLMIWYKRLEKGTFKRTFDHHQAYVEINLNQLLLALDGLDYMVLKQPKRWTPKI